MKLALTNKAWQTRFDTLPRLNQPSLQSCAKVKVDVTLGTPSESSGHTQAELLKTQLGTVQNCTASEPSLTEITAWSRVRKTLPAPRDPFLETPENVPGPKTVIGAQYSRIPIQFLLILKANF